jgi:hypothetical protein
MKPLTIIITFCVITTHLVAQVNFSGKWTLKEKQHILGPEYANALQQQMTIEQNKDSLIIESISTGADNKETKSRVSVPMNGTKVYSVSPTSGRKITRSLSWSADKKMLTITTPIAQQGNENEVELTRVDTWKLSADGKQLVINRKSIETSSENWEVKGVFERQL